MTDFPSSTPEPKIEGVSHLPRLLRRKISSSPREKRRKRNKKERNDQNSKLLVVANKVFLKK
jgi:hypothetical protein